MSPVDCVSDFNEAITLLINFTWIISAVIGFFSMAFGYLLGKHNAFKSWIESPLPCDECRQDIKKGAASGK